MGSKKIDDFHALLELPFENVALSLKKSDSETTQDFIYFLFKLIDDGNVLKILKFAAPHKKPEQIQQSLTICTWILSGGEEPTVYLNRVKQNSKSKICTKVWNDAYYFYRCRDCEMSPSR
jgi:hypothetical protein